MTCRGLTIYSEMFPRYFAPADLEALAAKLSGYSGTSWRNFYRLSDPVGGAIDPAHVSARIRDSCLDDPATGPLDVVPIVPAPSFPMPRATWGAVAGHSHYLAEPEVQRWIEQLRAVSGFS